MGEYREAPMLAQMVAAGKLPVVDQRLPKNPSVRQQLEEIGRYGETRRVFAVDPNPWNDLTESTGRGGGLPKVAPDGSIVGDLAERFAPSANKRTFTIWLREGTKWSDGAPFTVDDIMFMFEDLVWNEKVSTWNEFKSVTRLAKVDDYSLRLESDEPTPRLELKLATWQGGDWLVYQPTHYLQKWHIEYNLDANKLAKQEGSDIGMSLNLNHPEEWRAKLYQDLRFRRALSLTIDREEVNELAFLGLAVPRQTSTLPQNSNYKEGWGTAAAQYQPDRANRLLDHVGLTDRDRNGFRIAPNGYHRRSRNEASVAHCHEEHWQRLGRLRYGHVAASGAQLPRRPVFHPPVGDLLGEPQERAAILVARSSSLPSLP